MELKVRVHYRNDIGHLVSTREYSQRDYVDMMRSDIFRIISDVEAIFYRVNNGRDRSEWSARDIEEFNSIKHRQLDKAGALQRLPSSIEAANAMGGDIAKGLVERTSAAPLPDADDEEDN